jgi:Fe-S cluster biogenesis protein NfuA
MTPEKKSELIKRVELAINSIRPYLEADGGNVRVLNITDDFVAEVEFQGSCSSCSMSSMTLKAGVAETVKSAVPEIVNVVALT